MYDEEFDEIQGPFTSLRDALLETGLNQLWGAIGEFRTSVMSDPEPAQLPENHVDEDLVLGLNDVWCTVIHVADVVYCRSGTGTAAAAPLARADADAGSGYYQLEC